MNVKKKKEPPKNLEENLEQLLEEAKSKKITLLKILEKITKDNPENQTPN